MEGCCRRRKPAGRRRGMLGRLCTCLREEITQRNAGQPTRPLSNFSSPVSTGKTQFAKFPKLCLCHNVTNTSHVLCVKNGDLYIHTSQHTPFARNAPYIILLVFLPDALIIIIVT